METTLSIIALVISVISGGFALYTFIWTARRDRKQATLDAYNTLQEQALDHLNDYTSTEIKRIIEEKNKDEYRELSRCLARIEHFSVGVNTGIYDKTTVYEIWMLQSGTSFNRSWNRSIRASKRNSIVIIGS